MSLDQKIKQYKRKYYLKALAKGSIFAFGLCLSMFLMLNFMEYIGSWSSFFRMLFFFSFLLAVAVSFYYWVFQPLSALLSVRRQITDAEAARLIGKHFTAIDDKLLNLLQLRNQQQQNDLVSASIAQKDKELEHYQFAEAISLKQSRKQYTVLLLPLLALMLIILLAPEIILESTPRIVQYNTEFKDKAPFSFVLQNNDLAAYRNEDVTLELKIEGAAVPDEVYLYTADGRKLRMKNERPGFYSYEWKKLQRSVDFNFYASGFFSDPYQLQVRNRPVLRNFMVTLNYPDYTNKENERIENTGNLTVPEGTRLEWELFSAYTDSLRLRVPGKAAEVLTQAADGRFSFNYAAKKSGIFSLNLINEYGESPEPIDYQLVVVPDRHPDITLTEYQDTVLNQYLLIGGNIADDYGLTALNFGYRINNSANADKKFTYLPLSFNRQLTSQQFFHKMDLESLKLAPGDELEYFAEVWDNDGVNGRKRTRTSTYRFRLPSTQEARQAVGKQANQAEKEMNDALKQAQKLSKKFDEVKERTQSKKKLDYQDKKALEQLMEEREKLRDQIEQLQEKNQLLNQKNEKLTQNEQLKEKAEQLQKIMEELLDPETKKLYDELNKLLQENLYQNQNTQNLLDKLDFKQKNLEKELDRALELFKKLKFEQQAKQLEQALDELAKEQEEQAQQNLQEQNAEQQDEQLQNQKEINKKSEELNKELNKLNELNEDRKNKQEMQELNKQQEQLEQQQQEATEQLEQQQQKQAGEQQKKAAEQMKKMSQQLQQMQQQQQMQQMQENYGDLRAILENLITLSFEQEKVMLEFRQTQRLDPRFTELSQQQLKLLDDSQIVEDSLQVLAKKVFQIESFVTRELAQMNKYMNESMDGIRRRIPNLAAGKQQQAMTSMNNLALLLDDLLQQMQDQMSQQMSGQQNNQKQQSPSMSQMQKQLGEQLQKLRDGQKSGEELSKELAKMAAQQEMIRKAMEQQQKQGGGQSGSGGEKGMQDAKGEKESGKEEEGGLTPAEYKKMLRQMEQTEEDLINKQLTQETIDRQQEIITRMLESERAQKERDLDKKREAQAAEQQKLQRLNTTFEEYIRLKEAQLELLNTVPLNLNEYYKRKVADYFKTLQNGNR